MTHLSSYDPVLGGLALVGLLFALARARRWLRTRGRWADLVVLLGFAGTYFVILALYRNTLARYLLPLMPYFACLAAAGLAGIAGLATRACTPFVRALAFAALAFPSYALLEVGGGSRRAGHDRTSDRMDPAAAGRRRERDAWLEPGPATRAERCGAGREPARSSAGTCVKDMDGLPGCAGSPAEGAATTRQFLLPARRLEQRRNLRKDMDAYARGPWDRLRGSAAPGGAPPTRAWLALGVSRAQAARQPSCSPIAEARYPDRPLHAPGNARRGRLAVRFRERGRQPAGELSGPALRRDLHGTDRRSLRACAPRRSLKYPGSGRPSEPLAERGSVLARLRCANASNRRSRARRAEQRLRASNRASRAAEQNASAADRTWP